MTFTTDGGTITWQCDLCPNRLPTGTVNFETARNMLFEKHWQPFHIDGDARWKHRCDLCTPKVSATPRTTEYD